MGVMCRITIRDNRAVQFCSIHYCSILSKFIQKAVKIILVITKIEAKKLAEKGLRFHTDLFTGKWKRRRYYLREDWEGRNIKLLNEIRGNIVK